MKKIVIAFALVLSQLAFTAQAEARRGNGAAAIIGLGVGIAIGLNAHGHHGHYNGHYDDGPDWVCRAHNARGETFRSVGFSRRHAADKVIDKCYAYSRRCWIDSCHQRW